MTVRIRKIEASDNSQVEAIIRNCLIEFGADHDGTAWADPNLGQLYEYYNQPGFSYWVAEGDFGEILGGVGIGALTPTICELQKMYCLKKVRGKGISHMLMTRALEYANVYYEHCYLETLGNMIAARKFYEKYNFCRIYQPIVETPHFACDVRYLKDLR